MEMSKCLVERLARVIVFVTLSISLCSAGEPAEYMDVVTNTTAMRSFCEYNEEDFSNLRKSAIKGLREYRDRDLRFLKREESERLITLANRCREVPYWPAFVVEMASAFEPRLTVLVESPLLPEKNPPDGIIRMTIFHSDYAEASSPWFDRSYKIPGSLLRASVVTNGVSPFVGWLLKLEVVARGESRRALYYAVKTEGGLMSLFLYVWSVKTTGRCSNAFRISYLDGRRSIPCGRMMWRS
jgi:hypothetical protein